MDTFPAGTVVRRVSTSRGSDGHSMAVDTEGKLYSWGDGNYGKLGHGDNTTQKVPKLVSALSGKVGMGVGLGVWHFVSVI